MTPLPSVGSISKHYGQRIGFWDVFFDIFTGEVMGVVGERGSCKSMLLNCFTRHLPSDSHENLFDTCVDGLRDTLKMSELERRTLGRMDWASVQQNARDGLGISATAGGKVGERLMAVGMQQRLQITRYLVTGS